MTRATEEAPPVAEPAGAPDVRTAGPLAGAPARAAALVCCGLVAGFAVFALETVDRFVTLAPNLNGPGEYLRLAALSASIIFGVALLATVVALLATAADAVRRLVAAKVDGGGRGGRRAVAAFAVAALAIVAVLRGASKLVPGLLERRLYGLITRVDSRLFGLGPLARHKGLVYLALIALGVTLLLGVYAWLFSRRGPRARPTAAAMAALLFLAAAFGYYADLGFEYSRYEVMYHLPVEVVYCTLAIAGVAFAARAAGDLSRAAFLPAMRALAGVSAALGLLGLAFGAFAMQANQNVNELFWNRSVVARRVFQAARLLTDRDRDGASPYFGGGDPNDRDRSVAPLAWEVAGNGVDDNAVAGDLDPASALPVHSLYAPASGGGAAAAPPAAPAGGPQNVLLLSVDCLRADRLGCYGYGRPTSPNLDRFAAESVVFENAYSQGTNTGHSFASIFRSSYADDLFDARIPSFTLLLKEAGYRATFLNAIRSDEWMEGKRWGQYGGFKEGFDSVHADGEKMWKADRLTDETIRYLQSLAPGERHFTWVHYRDCHRPRKRMAEHDFGPTDSDIFDGTVAFTDEHLGRLFEYLRASGALANTLVIVTADHGEAFLEHGQMDHSNIPFLNNSHVPLVVYAPGVAAARVPTPCALVDIAPTALARAGVAPLPCYRGIDLLGALATGGLPPRPIVTETPRNLIQSPFYAWAYVDWPYKIIYDPKLNTTVLFDLAADPGEMHSLADAEPDLLARMRGELGAWLDRESARTAGSAGNVAAKSDDAD